MYSRRHCHSAGPKALSPYNDRRSAPSGITVVSATANANRFNAVKFGPTSSSTNSAPFSWAVRWSMDRDSTKIWSTRSFHVDRSFHSSDNLVSIRASFRSPGVTVTPGDTSSQRGRGGPHGSGFTRFASSAKEP